MFEVANNAKATKADIERESVSRLESLNSLKELLSVSFAGSVSRRCRDSRTC